MFVEKSTKKKIEDSKAQKVGYDCHARASVSYYAEYGSWRTVSKWEKIRQKFKVTAIHKNNGIFTLKRAVLPFLRHGKDFVRHACVF